ncbi:prolyl oligopeptidase family serine peptidase [Blastomonas fulva]|jgi:dipeptidyl-peptidase-4|uniref:S9 family peptidase n=1 Tax=Blastomonas fulva TaxID=1550728 RepID=UPI003D287BC9
MRLFRLARAVTLGIALSVMAGAAYATDKSAVGETALPDLYRAMLDAPTLVKGGDGIAAWGPDGSGLWYAQGGAIRLIDGRTGATVLTLDEARLRAGLVAVFGDSAKAAPLPLDSMEPKGDGTLALRWGGRPATVDLSSYAVSVTAAAGLVQPGSFLRYLFMYPGFPNPDVPSPDGGTIATVQADGNLAVRAASSDTFKPLTSDAAERFGWDLEGRRISIGALRAAPANPWSKDGRSLFAMKIDRRALPQMPEFRPLNDPMPDFIQRDVFPAGGPYYRYLPAIVDVTSGTQIPLDTDFGTDFVLFLSWSDDGRTAYLARLDRRFSKIEVIAADAATGRTRVILTESDPRGGLRSPHAIYYAGNLGFTLLPGNRGFLWLSERDGWNHIYHHAPDGRLIRQITRGDWRVENVSAVDPERGMIHFTARPDPVNLYDVHVMSVPLNGGNVRQLTQGRGTHDQPLFSPDKSTFVDRFESFGSPPRTELRDVQGKQIALVDKADASQLLATGWKPPLEFSVKGPDGDVIRGVMFRPFDFDPARQYPVIEYIYGGAQAIWAYPTFVAPGEAVGANMPLAMAQLGYVVVKFDTPGTPGRSRAFQAAITEKWGPGIAADHAAVIRSLAKEYPWMDISKVGIFGHSWGGLNVLHAMASQGDFYTAGVASAPGFGIPSVPDGFMENYLGSPQQNPEGWARADVMRDIARIRGPLMLVSGTQDYSIYVSTLRVSDALIKAGIQHEIALAPGQAHGIYGAYAKYLTEKEVRFFLKHIPPAKSAP